MMDLLVKKITKTENTEMNTKKKLDFKSKNTNFKALVNVTMLTSNPGLSFGFMFLYWNISP